MSTVIAIFWSFLGLIVMLAVLVALRARGFYPVERLASLFTPSPATPAPAAA